MSHKSTISTELNNKNYLLKALDKLGFTYKVAQNGETLTTHGKYAVNESVDILITGTGYTSNYVADVGFKKESDGTYTAVGDFFNLRDQKGNYITKEDLKCNVTAYSKEVETNERLQAFMFQMEEGSRKENNEELCFTMQRWV
jgi:hypothetical protein